MICIFCGKKEAFIACPACHVKRFNELTAKKKPQEVPDGAIHCHICGVIKPSHQVECECGVKESKLDWEMEEDIIRDERWAGTIRGR